MDLGLGLGNLTLPLKPLNGRIKFRLRFTLLQSTSCDPGHLRALMFPNNHHCLHQRSQRLVEGPKASEPQKASSKARESSPAPQLPSVPALGSWTRAQNSMKAESIVCLMFCFAHKERMRKPRYYISDI